MVYIDDNGQKYETQYCVILRQGEYAGMKHYVWASKEQIEAVFNGFGFRDEVQEFLGPNEVYFDRKSLSSLVFKCKNKETAIEYIRYCNLPPFLE